MVPRDVRIDFEPSEELTKRVNVPAKPQRLNKLQRRLKSAQGIARRAETSKGGWGNPKHRKPSMPTLPWDKKD